MLKVIKYILPLIHISVLACDTISIVEKKVSRYIYHKNTEGLTRYLTEQEAKDNPAAYFQHGYLYICGVIPKNAGLANFYFLKAIEHSKNHIHIKRIAQKAMADSLYSGDGCQQSLKLAHDYYLASAKLGYAPAMFNVAITFKELGSHKKYKVWMSKYNKNKNAR